MPTVEQAIEGYIRLRDERDAIRERHKNELAEVQRNMKMIEAWLQAQMLEASVDNMGSAAGTCYLSNVVRATVTDREEFMEFVREKELWALLTSAVSKDAVQEYMEAQGEAPPGVKVTVEQFARVKRK